MNRVMTFFLCLLVLTATLRAQGRSIDYNKYYRFPLSIGVEYQNLSPFAEYKKDYNIFELATNIIVPIPHLASLQPYLRLGMMRFDSLGETSPEKWDHFHLYGALGLGYAYRFARDFEVGGEFYTGFSEAIFPSIVAGSTLGLPNLLFSLGANISLDPTFNLSIGIHPSVKYLYSLGLLKEFDSLIFGIGFSFNYRFGEDPDSARALLRQLEFSKLSLPPVFAAMQSYYTNHPVGSVMLTNTGKDPATDIKVSFLQAGYMDSPTPCAEVEKLAPGEKISIDLFAVFNQEVFKTEGTTPLTGEVIVQYRSRGRTGEQRQSVTYDLYDKTAITWDNDQKVGAFITPSDSALRNYVSFIRHAAKEYTRGFYPEKVLTAVQVFQALNTLGVIYQADPTSPFTTVQQDVLQVDSVNLPRDTLRRTTGDCDDLTVLYNSLMETQGIATGFITTPGHIFSVFNTRIPSNKYRKVHPERGMTISYKGELWVPVEITLIGRGDFLDAWKTGSKEWLTYKNDPEKRKFYITSESQQVFRPVGLKETDLGLQYGSIKAFADSYQSGLRRLSNDILRYYRAVSDRKKSARSYNKLGIVYSQFARYEEAEQAFRQAARIEPGYAGVKVNLGNLAYLRKDYRNALDVYGQASEILKRMGRASSLSFSDLAINISKTHYALENYDKAKEYFDLASAINSKNAKRYSYLSEAGSGTSRAAVSVKDFGIVRFIDQEE
ncbi:MAG: tetratricopeptide repeat protein [Spirochaetes bacterium]|nr:tetratricopeptide repeat protein [Spirochaetota bacterium]